MNMIKLYEGKEVKYAVRMEDLDIFVISLSGNVNNIMNHVFMSRTRRR